MKYVRFFRGQLLNLQELKLAKIELTIDVINIMDKGIVWLPPKLSSPGMLRMSTLLTVCPEMPF